MKRFGLALVLLAAACHLRPRASRAFAPLEGEGEVFVYLQPMPQQIERLTFTLSSLAVSSEGRDLPLQLAFRDLPGPDPRQQRLLAFGRLPPGSYAVLLVATEKATLATPEGPAQLLVPGEPARVPAGFTIAAGRATVVTLTFRPEASVQGSFSFAPVFAAAVPPRPMPPLQGLCTSTAWNDLTVFDKRRREVVAVLPTGRGARGVALSPSLQRGWIALGDEDQLEAFDVSSATPLPRVRLAPGDGPRELAASGDGRWLYVVNSGSNSFAFLDALSGTEVSRVPTGEEPITFVVDRAGRRAYVLNQRSSTITVVDLAQRAAVGTVTTETAPLRAQVSRTGNRLYVIHAGSPYLLALSLPDLAVVNRVFIGLNASALKVDSRSDLIYVGKSDEARLYV